LVRWCGALRSTRTCPLDGARVQHSPSCHGDVPWPQRPEEVEFAMRPYEVMVIFDPDTDERQVQPTLEQHLNVVTKGGGSVDNVEVWGRRRLAYEIRKKAEGIYVVLTLTAAPADVKELDRQFTLNESIMRTKVLRADAR
jgi:small subunit ribosomal protein S6